MLISCEGGFGFLHPCNIHIGAYLLIVIIDRSTNLIVVNEKGVIARDDAQV